MKYLNVKPEERASIAAFREFCRHETVHLVLRKRAVRCLDDIVQGKPTTEASDTNITSLLRRGLIRSSGKGFVATELGLLAMAFAVAGGIASQTADVLPMKRAKKGVKNG